MQSSSAWVRAWAAIDAFSEPSFQAHLAPRVEQKQPTTNKWNSNWSDALLSSRSYKFCSFSHNSLRKRVLDFLDAALSNCKRTRVKLSHGISRGWWWINFFMPKDIFHKSVDCRKDIRRGKTEGFFQGFKKKLLSLNCPLIFVLPFIIATAGIAIRFQFATCHPSPSICTNYFPLGKWIRLKLPQKSSNNFPQENLKRVHLFGFFVWLFCFR